MCSERVLFVLNFIYEISTKSYSYLGRYFYIYWERFGYAICCFGFNFTHPLSGLAICLYSYSFILLPFVARLACLPIPLSFPLSLSPSFSASFQLVFLFFLGRVQDLLATDTKPCLGLNCPAKLSQSPLSALHSPLSPHLVDCSRINLCLFRYQFAALRCLRKKCSAKKRFAPFGKEEPPPQTISGGRGEEGSGGEL